MRNERESERKRETERGRQADRGRERETERDRERNRDRDRERQTEIQTRGRRSILSDLMSVCGAFSALVTSASRS